MALLANAPFPGFGLQRSSVRLSARCFFGQVRLTRSHITGVTLAVFGNGDWYRSACPLLILSFLTGPAENSRVRVQASRFVFRQVRQGAGCIGIHRHLTIRSSRPRVVASAVCFTLRLHTSAAPPRVGLTQALGLKWKITRTLNI